MHFRSVKDSIALPLHRFGHFLAGLPDGFGRALMGSIGILGKVAYFLPGSHLRKTIGNFCAATGRSDPWPIYSRMVNGLEHVALHYATLARYDRTKLLSQTDIDPGWVKEYQRWGGGKSGIIILVPHCAAAVLSSGGLSNFCPTTLLVREPKSDERRALMFDYIQKIGPKFIQSRIVPPATVMRNIVRALRDVTWSWAQPM